MALSGNKGEWSEIYTLFRLLGEGKIHAGDSNMNKLEIYYPIINIIREETGKFEYKPNVGQKIVIIDEDGREFARIPMDKFMKESEYLLKEIKAANKPSFRVPSSERFMLRIGCGKLKASSKDKSDIHIMIHDMRTNMTPTLGFSIKSQLGSASTLLNAGETTNVLYKVVGRNLSDEDLSRINGISAHISRIEALFGLGCHLEYCDIEHPIFKNNLLFLDTMMPEFIAECLIYDSIFQDKKSVKNVVEKIAENNPFNFTGKNVVSFYEHKMKVLLLDSALGMTPAKEWNGRYDANGGYIVVRKDGEIVCYHFYNRNDVEDYLYNNTRFERASRTRYHFGSIFRGEDGLCYMRLNLQIRFVK